MPSLRVGQTDIEYELRRTTLSSQRRIIVTPDRVEVLVLTTDDDDAIEGFLARKRKWVFDTVREMERITANRHSVPRFMTGSKIPYRGRRLPLTVRRSSAERIEIEFRNGFTVDLPAWAGQNTDSLVASELKLWLKQSARRYVAQIAAKYSARYGLIPRSIRTVDFANAWGSCGPQGNISINWELIFAPPKVLDYVVLHELTHLRHRSHDPAFWDFLRSLAPNFEASKQWLDTNQVGLSAEFLNLHRPQIARAKSS